MADDQVKGTPAAADGVAEDAAAVSTPGAGVSQRSSRADAWKRLRELIRTIREGDDAMVEAAVVQLSHMRRSLAPLALAVGALAMLFHGLRLLVFNWRLALVQILPAMWIWAAMLDLKGHVLHGASFRVGTRPRPGPHHAGRRRHHRGQLLPQCRVRVRHRQARPAGDPAGVR